MNTMLNGLRAAGNTARTENGALVRRDTGSKVLDFFSKGGALRNTSASVAQNLFSDAWAENPELALKAMFYFRDVRGGQGQRGAFRNQLTWLANVAPETVRKNIGLIAEYGRWDDIYALVGTKVEADAFGVLTEQLQADMRAAVNDQPISLLAKWLKSENASSQTTKALARKTRKALGWNSKQYRKVLSTLRNKLDVVETKISAKEWEGIKYQAVPSQAMMKYRKAFRKNDEDRFARYMDAVTSGEAKINAATLYPYQIVERAFNHDNAQELDALWNALPDYVAGSEENSIAVVDTSDSMSWHGTTPRDVAVSLGMYLAERAKGPYKDHFITFSQRPQLQRVIGNTIVDKARNLFQAAWDGNTNIEAVFDLILDIAVKNRLAPEDMIQKLYIISDMQFDQATGNGWSRDNVNRGLFDTIRARYESAGYQLPQLVFWNVDARDNTNTPMSLDDRGFVNVSGFSPSIFKNLMDNKFLDAYGMMENVLQSDRYAALKV